MREQSAFTLIELMVTLVVLAIVLMVALPSFNSQIQNNRSLALGEDLASALSFARSEAVKRGKPISLCASNDDQSDCGADWRNGWLVAVDDAAETATTTSVDEILRVWDSVPQNAVLQVERADSFSASSGTAASIIRYTGLGTLARIDNETKVVRVTAYSDGCTGKSQQQLLISFAGMISSTREECP